MKQKIIKVLHQTFYVKHPNVFQKKCILSVGKSKNSSSMLIRDVNLKIAFVIKGGKARKVEVSPQQRLHIYTSAFL